MADAKILFLGNSYSLDSARWLWHVAHSVGVDLDVGLLYHGGRSIKTMASSTASSSSITYTFYEWYTSDDPDESDSCIISVTDDVAISTVLSGTAQKKWDYVFVQQKSEAAGFISTFTDDDCMTTLLSYIKQANSASKIGYLMPWACLLGYDSSSTDEYSFASAYNSSSFQMIAAIISTTQNVMLTYSDIDLIVPVGVAVQNARSSRGLRDTGKEFSRDYHHLHYGGGRLLAALTVFGTLYPSKIDAVSFFPTENDKYTGSDSTLSAECGEIASTSSKQILHLVKIAVKNALMNPHHLADIGNYPKVYSLEDIKTTQSKYTLSYNASSADDKNCFYIVKDGICTVQLHVTCTSASTSATTVATGLPAPSDMKIVENSSTSFTFQGYRRDFALLRSSETANNPINARISPEGELSLHGGATGGKYAGSIAYPIKA